MIYSFYTEERRYGEKRRDQRHYTMRSLEIYDCDDGKNIIII